MPAASSLTRARRSISDERSMPIAWLGARAEQFDHPPGAGADIEQPAERPLAKRSVDRLLDLAFGDMERADLSHVVGMGGEIAAAASARSARIASSRAASAANQRARSPHRPAIDQLEHGSVTRARRRASGIPSCPPCGGRASAGVGEDPDMARDPRLALPEQLAPVRRPTAPSTAAARGCAAGWDRQAPGKARKAVRVRHRIRI